jgi:hypothetical protein
MPCFSMVVRESSDHALPKEEPKLQTSAWNYALASARFTARDPQRAAFGLSFRGP